VLFQKKAWWKRDSTGLRRDRRNIMSQIIYIDVDKN
jgi:hypothetical protein